MNATFVFSPPTARLQLDRGQLLEPRVLLPHPAAPDCAPVPQASHPDDAQVAAEAPRSQVLVRRNERRHLFQEVSHSNLLMLRLFTVLYWSSRLLHLIILIIKRFIESKYPLMLCPLSATFRQAVCLFLLIVHTEFQTVFQLQLCFYLPHQKTTLQLLLYY